MLSKVFFLPLLVLCDDMHEAVILTRFSRVTFNAAHKYLGLTKEVLRTEKAINDIACHPLPSSFYEGGGLQYLRHRFDAATSNTSEGEDYFSLSSSPTVMSPNAPRRETLVSSSMPSLGSHQRAPSATFHGTRRLLPAGDLLISQGRSDDGNHRGCNVLGSPRMSRNIEAIDTATKANHNARGRILAEDFDLREEVMSCIAKSIGLCQPPLSGGDSVEASPALRPFDFRRAAFDSPFGTLSLLDLGDDTSSGTGSSCASATVGDGYLSGLDNDVEILFYAAGTTLVKAGEHNTGMGGCPRADVAPNVLKVSSMLLRDSWTSFCQKNMYSILHLEKLRNPLAGQSSQGVACTRLTL